MTNEMGFTVHGVLAGAYKGKDVAERALLLHVSEDGGATSLCRKVKADHLCDMQEDEMPTCPECLRRAGRKIVKRLGL
jgi:hypothetical protein